MRSVTHLRSAKMIKSESGQTSYQGSVGSSDPNRYYQFRLSQRSSLNLSLSNLKSNANLTLLNAAGKTISRSTRKGQSNEAIAQTVDSGVYYVQVSRQQGKTHYKLNIKTDAVQQDPALGQSSATPPSLADQVVALVNEQRQQAGLKPVRLNPLLSAAAQAHSQDMALNDFFGHTGSNNSSAATRIAAAGYDYNVIGENIAAGFATPEAAVQAWMDSPGHRANILHPMLEEMGVGFYFLENDAGQTNFRYYWTQDFGQPMF